MQSLLIAGILVICFVRFSFGNDASSTDVTPEDRSQTNKVVSGQLAEKGEDESLADYCIRYFARFPFEDEQLYVARVFHKYENEDENGYLLRIRTVLEVFNTFNGWYNVRYLDSTKQYFTLEYQQQEGESEETYYKRVFSKKTNESFDVYRSRIKLLVRLFPKLDFWQKGDHSKINGLQGKQSARSLAEKPEVAISERENVVPDQHVSQQKERTQNSESPTLPSSEKSTTTKSAVQLNADAKSEAAAATGKTAVKPTQLDLNLDSDSALRIGTENSVDTTTQPEQTETNTSSYSAADAESEAKTQQLGQPGQDTTKSNETVGAEAESETKAQLGQPGQDATKSNKTVGAEAEVGASSVAHGDENSETTVSGAAKETNKHSESGAVSESAINNSKMNAKPVQNTAAGSKAASMSETKTESDLGMSVTSAEGNSNTLEEKKYGETEERYCKRIFSQRDGEDEKSYVKRVFNKYDDETEEEYIHRLDVVITVVQSKCFYNYKYKFYTQYYMAMKYRRQRNEYESTYLQRILTKKQEESFQIYTLRIVYLRKFIPNLSCWARFRFDKSSNRGYTLDTRKASGRYRHDETEMV